jgi:hypothetical protein
MNENFFPGCRCGRGYGRRGFFGPAGVAPERFRFSEDPQETREVGPSVSDGAKTTESRLDPAKGVGWFAGNSGRCGRGRCGRGRPGFGHRKGFGNALPGSPTGNGDPAPRNDEGPVPEKG